MTELSFLLDLLLKHKLPDETKEAVAVRLKEVEQDLLSKTVPMPISRQAPSTIALMQKHGDIAPPISPIAPQQEPVIQPHVDENMRQRSMEAAMRARKNRG